MKEECGVFGIYQNESNTETCRDVIKGLSKIQHRGQESAGISYVSNNKISNYKKPGLVKEVFTDFTDKETNMCIGHVRYSTSKCSAPSIENAQPFIGHNSLGTFSLAHNGHIPNIDSYKHNCSFEYTTDSDFLTKYIGNILLPTWEEIMVHVMKSIPGVYCLLIMTDTSIYVLRDRYGIRPLCIGQNKKGLYVSSENCAISNCDYIFDVEPGQIIELSDNIYNVYDHPPSNLHCMFEFIYFSSPKSTIDKCNIRNIRKEFGRSLAKQEKCTWVTNTIVIGSPSSGILAGRGYAEELRLPYYQILIKNENYLRSFIMPNQKERLNICQNKFKLDMTICHSLKNITIIIVDDSIVRGNTMKNIVNLFRNKGVKEIHVRSAAPPIRYPCYFGIDMSSKKELVANKVENYEDLAKYFGCTTVDYLTQYNLEHTVYQYNPNLGLCGACFNGKYNEKLLNW